MIRSHGLSHLPDLCYHCLLAASSSPPHCLLIDNGLLTSSLDATPLWQALAELTIVLDSRENKKMRVTRVRLTSGERLVGIKVPYGRLRNWRAILQRAGVVMDDEALGTINLIEKDAGETATRSAAAEQPVKSDGATGTPGEPAGRPGKRKATEQAGLGRRQMNTDYW